MPASSSIVVESKVDPIESPEVNSTGGNDELVTSNNELTTVNKQSNVAKLTSGSTIEEMIRLRNLKTSQNITESVPVPSSEHVAEIVGRQGCKIKALRAKTNTYIKTPIRGEQPQFVITGRKEDVITAKREIQLAADHFSQIRARRGGNNTPIQSQQLIPSPCDTRQGTPTPPINTPNKTNSVSSSSSSSISISPPAVHKINNVQDISASISPKFSDELIDIGESTLIRQQTDQVIQLQPGQIITKVSVPYQVVGLVVGPRGTTIKRIQQNTNTYIITPSRDSQPVFAIQGLPENVAQAKIEIENYIQLRTNNNTNSVPSVIQSNGYSSSSSSSSTSSSSDSANYFCASANNVLSSFSSNDYEFFSNGIELMDDLKLVKKAENNNTLLQESSIWSSPVSTFTQSDDCLVNSIQQNLNPTLNSINGIRSSLSSASSTSSSASSSFSLAKNDNTFQFFNSSQADNLSGLISGLESLNIMPSYGTKANDPFLGTLNENSGYSASSSLSSSSSNDNAHSIFQQHENLFTNQQGMMAHDTFSHDLNNLYSVTGGASNFLTNFQQHQPQYF